MNSRIYNYKINLKRVIDANTIVADIDLGFNIVQKDVTIQLLQVEEQTNTYTFEEYKERLINNINDKQLIINSTKLDGFGRAEAYLHSVEGDELVNINLKMNAK